MEQTADVSGGPPPESSAPTQEPVSGQSAPTPADTPPPDAPAPAPAPEVQPVRVDNLSKRSDDDVLEGHFATVVNGEHKGQVGAFVQVVEYGPDGYPDTVLIRFRDHNYHTDLAGVPYADIRPADPYKGGR